MAYTASACSTGPFASLQEAAPQPAMMVFIGTPSPAQFCLVPCQAPWLKLAQPVSGDAAAGAAPTSAVGFDAASTLRPRPLVVQGRPLGRPSQNSAACSADASPLCHMAGRFAAAAAKLDDCGLQSMAGRVYELSQTAAGCRAVQQAIEEASDDGLREVLISELKGHVLELLFCPYGNYVLQKSIMTSRPAAFQFIIDEVLRQEKGSVRHVAKHKFGCRVLQRLLEYCQADQLNSIYNELAADTLLLCRHRYGTYVMKHMFEHGTASHTTMLSKSMQKSIYQVATDLNAVGVLGKALESCSEDEVALLIGGLLAEKGLLAKMARTRCGHATAKLLLEMADAPSLEEAHRQLEADVGSLRPTRYGRSVLTCLASLLKGAPVPSDELSEELQLDQLLVQRSGSFGEQVRSRSYSVSEELSL